MKMVILNEGNFKWIGGEVPCYYDSLKSPKFTFYNAFTQNDECFYVNDIVLIKTSSGINKVAKLLAFYESDAHWHKNARFRGIVTWYTFMTKLPKVFTIDTKFDDNNEVVEDFRTVNADIFVSLENILRKCSLIFATAEDPINLIDSMNLDKDTHFSCRYRINTNKLLPIYGELDLTELIKLDEVESTPKTKNLKRKPNDENEFPTPKAASPVKCVKLSPKKSNVAVLTPNRAKRNLNESFDISQTDFSQLESSQLDTPTLNYSIVDENPQPLKLKLRLSEKQNFNPKVVIDKLDDELLNSVLSNRTENLRRSARANNRKSYADYISPFKTRSGRSQSSDSDLGLIEFKIPSKNSLETITDVPQDSIAEINLVDEPKVHVLIQKTPSKRGRALSVTFENDVVTPKKHNLEIMEEVERSPDRPIKNESQATPGKRIRNQAEGSRRTPGRPKKSQESPKVSPPKSRGRPKKPESATRLQVEKPKRASIKPIRYQELSDTEGALRKILSPLKLSYTPQKEKEVKSRGRPRKTGMQSDEQNLAKSRPQNLDETEEQLQKLLSPLKLNFSPRKTRKMSTDSEVTVATPEKRTKTPKKVQIEEYATPRKTRRTRNMSTDSEAAVATPEKRPKTPKKVQIEEYSTPRKAYKEDKAPKTPKNTPGARMKLIREGVITPSMQNRKNAIPTASTPLNMARTKLHVSYVPNVLPCREKEFSDISAFVQGKLLDGCGGCMYISGVPGTGKTATVTEVIRNLQEMSAGKDLPSFTYVNINGMRLTEPRQSYVEIYKQLTGKTVAWEQAQTLLENKFTKSSGSKKTPIVLLVDELDILCTKRQDVVYNLLDWPTKAVNQLIVITIANTMDLPERLLMGRVTSRLGLTRLTFQAYTHKQLQEIIMKRLMGTNAFNPDAVQLVARKVASVSGDARRALDICRRAVEIAEAQGGNTLVSMTHVNEALNTMITQPKVRAIKRCSRLEQLILQSVVAEVERTGVDETTFSDVYTMLMSVTVIEGFKMVATSLVLAAVARLGACRLLLTDQKSNDLHQRLILNVTSDDIYYALRKD